LSTSLGDSTVDGVAPALVELIHARVDASRDVECHSTVEIVAGVIIYVGKFEPVRVK